MEFLIREVALAASLTVSPQVDADQLLCMTRNMFHEARGETRQGQAAVW